MVLLDIQILEFVMVLVFIVERPIVDWKEAACIHARSLGWGLLVLLQSLTHQIRGQPAICLLRQHLLFSILSTFARGIVFSIFKRAVLDYLDILTMERGPGVDIALADMYHYTFSCILALLVPIW